MGEMWRAGGREEREGWVVVVCPDWRKSWGSWVENEAVDEVQGVL
jgi:hypothetical protein